jgi:hypothetical protein
MADHGARAASGEHLIEGQLVTAEVREPPLNLDNLAGRPSSPDGR